MVRAGAVARALAVAAVRKVLAAVVAGERLVNPIHRTWGEARKRATIPPPSGRLH